MSMKFTTLLLLLVSSATTVDARLPGSSVNAAMDETSSNRVLEAVVAGTKVAHEQRKADTLDFWGETEVRNGATERNMIINHDDGNAYVAEFVEGKYGYRWKPTDKLTRSATAFRPKDAPPRDKGKTGKAEKEAIKEAAGAGRKLQSVGAISNILLTEPEDGGTAMQSGRAFLAILADAKSTNVRFHFVNSASLLTTVALIPEDEIVNGQPLAVMADLELGDGIWWVTATDSQGNDVESEIFDFASEVIPTNTGIGGTSDAPWELHGQVQDASGRLYYEMPLDANGDTWGGYVCSGTVVHDNKSGRSLIMTAAHCIYDVYFNPGYWARNIIFIPNQEDSTVVHTDRNCENDPCGCWTASGGVIHKQYEELGWPGGVQFDYGFYVVDDTGAHTGPECGGSNALDIAIEEMLPTVTGDNVGQHLYALGYPVSPATTNDLRYCDDNATTATPGGKETLYLPGCTLGGGSSGGPWIRNMDESTGKGEIVSVNSWSYQYSDGTTEGMGGPTLVASEARCLANTARSDYTDMDDMEATQNGVFADCADLPCVGGDTEGRRLRGGRSLCGGKE